MAMHTSDANIPSQAGSFGRVLSSAATTIRATLWAIAGFLVETGKQIQIAKMQAVLSEMSDQRLEKLGIKRSEIRQHSERLVTGGNENS